MSEDCDHVLKKIDEYTLICIKCSKIFTEEYIHQLGEKGRKIKHISFVPNTEGNITGRFL